MSWLHTGGPAVPQAARPARAGHEPTDQADRSRVTRGPGSWPKMTARRAAGRRGYLEDMRETAYPNSATVIRAESAPWGGLGTLQ